MRPWPSLQSRFLAQIRPKESCIEWAGVKIKGYGIMKVNGRRKGAHRISYEIFVGPIPRGLHLDHLCRNPKCVNPLHLEPVTIAENFRRGINANSSKSHCPSGHAYNDENTRVGVGGRVCKTCHRISEKNRRLKRKETTNA